MGRPKGSKNTDKKHPPAIATKQEIDSGKTNFDPLEAFFASIEQLINLRFNALENILIHRQEEIIDGIGTLLRSNLSTKTDTPKTTSQTQVTIAKNTNGVDNSDDILDMFS